ncbi:hypothetical protein [Ottowia sp.]|uniref:hypothetical protein n=1 Tax=Ottowia sp. TaxID=1898956 RepID=UPI003A8A9566
MKHFTFQIDAYQAQWMLSPIRSKNDIIYLLMQSIKIMLLPNVTTLGAVGEMTLQVEKMNRLIFDFEKKIFSINFPFTAIEDNNALTFRSNHHPKIDSKVASEVLSVITKSEKFESKEVLHFADPISDYCQFDDDFWSLFRELLMFEDGYIRYDHDESRSNGHLHPLHHFDVFYSSGSTFKLGSANGVSREQFVDVLNLNTNCHFVSPIN